MGWLNKTSKRSNGRSKEGHGIRSDDGSIQNQASTSSQDSLSKYNEDLQKALALSLSEDEQRKAKAAVSLEEDELLARALQESLNVEYPQESGFYQPIPYHQLFEFGRKCAGCNTEIGPGSFLRCMGTAWHPNCFICHACNRPIENYEFSVSGNAPYHPSCYRELHYPKCEVCKKFIPVNMSGLVEYRTHPFWKQIFCPSHEFDGTSRCCSCERMEPRDTRYATLDDGRKLCLECLDSSIMDTSECQPLYTQIKEFYTRLNMKIEQHIPLLLVERRALNEAMEGEKHGRRPVPETRGICLSEDHIISTVARRPSIGIGKRLMGMKKESYKLALQCEVTAILVLYGLPRLATGSVLAHEMMHAWLRLNGYRNLRAEVEEGICQVLAHMWLKSELRIDSGSNVASTSSSLSSSSLSKKGTMPQFERKLGDFFKRHIEVDSSSAYGDGFRAGNKAVLQYGLKSTLDHIKLTGSFPL